MSDRLLSAAPHARHKYAAAFTLVELSVALVVIGLIVGGILIGQNLIASSGVQAQISQIEKFNAAANTFSVKYGYLPGDIPAAPAAQFGFAARGQYAGEGDGDGNICGVRSNAANSLGASGPTGEAALFWQDLGAANLIDGNYPAASATQPPAGAGVNSFLPAGKVGTGNYVYVWCTAAGATTNWSPPGANYFGLSMVNAISMGNLWSTPGLTVAQAYAIDSKIDDGLPQTGEVMAIYLSTTYSSYNPIWASTSGYNMTSPTTLNSTAGSSATCFDNGSVYKGTQRYSLAQQNGARLNCALSFRMKAGDY